MTRAFVFGLGTRDWGRSSSSEARGPTTTPPTTIPVPGRQNSFTKPSRTPCIFARALPASGTNVALFGSDQAWIGTTASRVLRSPDGGRSWTATPTPLATGQATGIFSIAFRDAKHGVIVGGDYRKEAEAIDNAAVTTDGGATWSLVRDPGMSGFRSVVAWLPRTTGAVLALGPSGADWSSDAPKSCRAIAQINSSLMPVMPSANDFHNRLICSE